MVNAEIREIADRLKREIHPLRIYLFGSFANDTFTEDSDYDFYLVVPDAAEDRILLSQRAYRALRGMQKRPVDIVVGNESLFNARAVGATLENTVREEGVFLESFEPLLSENEFSVGVPQSEGLGE